MEDLRYEVLIYNVDTEEEVDDFRTNDKNYALYLASFKMEGGSYNNKYRCFTGCQVIDNKTGRVLADY